jgi:hypothetical protein
MQTLPLRTTLFVTAVAAMVLVYLLWWTTYAEIHIEGRYTQRPAGATGKVGGTSIRLLSLTRSPLLADQKSGGPPDKASPGTTWVVADLEGLQRPGAPKLLCTFELIGPAGRAWENQGFLFDRSMPSCTLSEFPPGTPVRFEEVFLVPERFADQLVGVALVDHSVARRTPVVVPPA